MERLRAPGGCPWDQEQTFESIKPYTLEETYEVLEAIDNRDWPELAGELGDLLLQVLFYAEMAKEQSSFSIDDVLDRLSTKLIDRHPHVFGDVKADTSDQVKRNWEAIKVQERKKRQAAVTEGDAKSPDKHSILAGISSAMPSLLEASKLSFRAAQAGFESACNRIEPGLFPQLSQRCILQQLVLVDMPAIMHLISRPLDSWSMVADCLASQKGSRIGRTASAVPTRMRVVAAAQNDNTAINS